MNTKRSYDVIIVGGGIMGSSTAYHLMKTDAGLSVAVVEKDPSYEKASTPLSMANIRIQFSLKENIRISQYAFQVIKGFEEEMMVDGDTPDIGFRPEGNLFMVPEDRLEAARSAYQLQKDLGCPIEWWDNDKIRDRYPLYDPKDYVGGTFGPEDGYLDAYGFLMGFKNKARSMGAQYIHGEVTSLDADGGRVGGVTLASGERISAKYVVNCAGPWCTEVAKTAGITLPITPVARQIFAVSPAVQPDGPLPLTFLRGELYFRTETGGLILIGKSMDSDRKGFDFNWDQKRFQDVIWPEIWDFVPAFDRLKLIRGWAGLYAVNDLDSNAILGEWPDLKGLFLANGFSGHGLQQGPAVGRYMSELILEKPVSLDLSIFSPQRILEGRPLAENGIV